MGDKVERALEETVPLLRQVRRLKLLSEEEITTLVRRRRDHEYALLRPQASRADFMRYAAFERETAKFLQARAEEKQLPEKRVRSVTSRQASRVNLVYSRAIRKFKGDDALYLHYAKHCIATGSRKAADKVFGKAIAYRGDSEKVWLAAAAFHFESCGDIKVARAISQRGLRALKSSKKLWLEYFRLELAYLAKLVARRTTIGMASTEGGEEKVDSDFAQNERDSSKEDTSGVPLSEETELKGLDDSLTTAPTKKLDFWSGGVPFAVFRSALSNAQLGPSDAASYLQVASSMQFVPTRLLETMADTLRDQFDVVSTPILHATVGRSPFDVACSRVFLCRAAREAESGQAQEGDTETKESALVSTALAATWAVLQFFYQNESHLRSISAQVSGVEHAFSEFKDRANLVLGAKMPSEMLEKFKMVERALSLSDTGDTSNFAKTSNASLSDVVASQSSEKWKEFLQSAAVSNMRSEGNVPALASIRKAVAENAAAIPFRSEEQERICIVWCEWEDDVMELRKICENFMKLPPMTMGLVRASIEAELRLSSGNPDNCAVSRVRLMFDKAGRLPEASNDVEFWIRNVWFERDVAKDASRASSAMWKANSSLTRSSKESFRDQCILLNLR